MRHERLQLFARLRGRVLTCENELKTCRCNRAFKGGGQRFCLIIHRLQRRCIFDLCFEFFLACCQKLRDMRVQRVERHEEHDLFGLV